MLKLLDILQEGAIQLTPDERQQVEEMLPTIIKIMSGKSIGNNMETKIGTIDFIYADKKTPGKVDIFIGNDLSAPDANGYFLKNDPNNPIDNKIFIQQFRFQPYFGIEGKVYSTFTGDKNQGIELLRKTLKHELIHAKDPALNQYLSKEPYDSSKEEIYYKSWTEFQTMTGQFFEAITTGVDRALNNGVPKEKILKILNNILNVYAGGKYTSTGKETLTQDTVDFIQDTGKRNIFQSLIKFAENTISSITGTKILNALDAYVAYLGKIKMYNPEGYKEFLKDLYKTIDQAKDKLNNLKEMKYINEAKRLQQLAGIINESQLNEEEQLVAVTDKVEDKLQDFENQLKSFAKTVKPSPKDKELNEIEPVSTIATIIAGAPGLLTFLGKGVDAIADIVTMGDVQKTLFGKALQKAGHKLEHAYIDGIASILKGFFPETYANQNQHDETSVLHDHCHAIYAAIVGAAAIVSGMGAAQTTGIIQTLEAGASGLKTAEVIALAQKIVAA